MLKSQKMHTCDENRKETWDDCEACEEIYQRFDRLRDVIGALAVVVGVACIVLLSVAMGA